MTERKPPDVSFETWIDKQIREAQERGEFDDLPGAGKPIPDLDKPFDEMRWVANWARREGLPVEALLPTPLQLRKEIHRLPDTVRDLPSEQAVREVVEDLNQRIRDWIRQPTEPRIVVVPVDADGVVERWRTDRQAAAESTVPAAVTDQTTADEPPPRRVPRWRRIASSARSAGKGRARRHHVDFDAYERRLWAGRGTDYDRGFARLTAHTAGALLDAAGVMPGARLLDVGTGTGVVAGPAAARGARVTAVDAEPSMAETAARNVPGLDVRVAILPELPLPSRSFDAVVGNFVINAVGDPPAALAELRRVLRTGGRLALTCWTYPLSPAVSVVGDAIDAAGVPWPDDIPVPPFRAYGSPDAFVGLLTEAGFTDVTAERLTWEHRVDPERWWAGPLSGVGTSGVVIGRQDAATVARIKNEFDRLVAPYATGDGHIALPAAAVLASGTR